MMKVAHGRFTPSSSASSSSNSHRQCAARSCSNYNVEAAKNDTKSGRQQNLSRGPGLLNGPSKRSAPQYTQYSGREVRQSKPTTEEPLEPSSSSPAINSYPMRHIRQSSPNVLDGLREDQDSASLQHIFTQYATGAETSNQTSGPASVFEVPAEENFSLGAGTALGVPSHRTSSQDLPFTTEFDNFLSDDVYLHGLCGFPGSPNLPVCTPNHFSNTVTEQDEPMLNRNFDYFSIENRDNISGVFSPMALDNCSNPKGPPNSVTCIESCSERNRICMASATKILKSLHITSTACLCRTGNESITPGPRQPRMTDSVLTGNRDVVTMVSKMLKCICSLRPQVQLVLSIICDKLIAWCRAMIRSNYDGCSESPSVGNGIRNDKDQAERVLRQPITIGDHRLDGVLESKIRAQVILGELQRLEALIENLARRIKESTCGASAVRAGRKVFTTNPSSPMLSGEPGLPEIIHGRLAAFLRRQLQAAKTDMGTLLGDGRKISYHH